MERRHRLPGDARSQPPCKTPADPKDAGDGLGNAAIRLVRLHQGHRVNSTIHLSFRYAESDYVRAMRAHYASQLRPRLDIPVTVVVLAIGLYLLRSTDQYWLGLALIVVAAAFVILLVAAFTVIPRLAFRREPKFRDEYSLTFSAEGIHFRTEHIDSQLEWSLYSRAMIDAHSYVLYYGARQFTVIPKRVFQSAEQQEAFERLLTRQIPQIARLDA